MLRSIHRPVPDRHGGQAKANTMQIDFGDTVQQTVTLALRVSSARQMSFAALRQLGAHQVAYLRPVVGGDSRFGYALYRADGTAIDLVADLPSLIERLEQSGLALATLH